MIPSPIAMNSNVKLSRLLALAGLLLAAGCGQNPYALSQSSPQLPLQQPQTPPLVAAQGAIQQRAEALDRDNRELQSQLAQAQRQNRLLEDQLAVVRQQLQTTTQQLAAVQNEKQGIEKHTRALAASVQRQAGATIRANNTLLSQLTVAKIEGVEVRQDGDVVRIELPGEMLFQPGSATLRPESARVIDGVMADVLQQYPRQMLGIEGHTDSDPIRSAAFPSNHHLSTARATAVYEQIMSRRQVPPAQLFVVGHGPNHPVVSNATPAGKARNRRVEVVVYPDTYQP
ncbi:MAG: OmpA family protein [Planctomycetales bacterium]|nr:OmpA family protein [Planctomycetales bacterium]